MSSIICLIIAKLAMKMSNLLKIVYTMHQINYIKLPNYQSKKGSKTIFVF